MRRLVTVLALVLLAAACGTQPSAEPPSTQAATGLGGTLRLYTSVSQEPVDGVLAAFADAYPGIDVELFRAPTGELNARLAAERREGGISADVLWLSDPLSMQQYAGEGLLRGWEPAGAGDIAAAFRSDTFWGTHFNEVVVVHQPDVPAPGSWQDLTTAAYREVAVPDPAFAGTAFGALGYFALADGYGLDYYRALADNGAVQVQAPDEVLTGVAEGRFTAGMALAFSARDAIADGAPVRLARPDPGAIAVYSPVAVFEASQNQAAAEALVEFLLTPEAQELLVEAGGYEPIRAAGTGDRVAPDWSRIFRRQDELLEEYQAIFGG